MGMTIDELREMVKGIVGEAVAAAVEPLKSQQTDWMGKILASATPLQPEDPADKGLKAARYLRALAAGKGDPERASRYVRQVWHDETLAKALGESVLAEGGALVPTEYVAEVIELLRGRAVVRSLGATTIPMNSGSATIPKLTGGATASYVGENQPAPKSQPSTGSLQLAAKKLMALVPVSNDLLRDASPSADTIVRDDLVSAMALREDLAFIRDDGTQNTPKGMRHWATAGNILGSTGITLAQVTSDLGKMVLALEGKDVRFLRPGWILNPRSKWFLWQLADANGNYPFREELNQGKLLTFPFKITTQVPTNLGAGGNESELYLADFADMVIGENTQVIIDVSTEAAYHDGTNVVAAFSNDQTVMRAIARHDFGSRHDESISVLTGVTWGA